MTLALYTYSGANPLIYIDPDGKELVRVKFGKSSGFNNKSIVVDRTFVPVLVAINEEAKSRGIKILVTNDFRPEDKVLNSTVRTPANRSPHKAGRGLDINLTDKDGAYYRVGKNKDGRLWTGKLSDNVRGFFETMENTEVTTTIDSNKKIRWGERFNDGRDPVHFDLPTDKKTWEKLFKENQEQHKSGAAIETYKID